MSSFPPGACRYDEIYWSQHVLSPVNLASFEDWTLRAAEHELDYVFSIVFVICHCPNPSTIAEWMPRPYRVGNDNRVWRLLQKMCQEVNCPWCLRAEGLEEFHWVGPWTCPASIGEPGEDFRITIARDASCPCALHGERCMPEGYPESLWG